MSDSQEFGDETRIRDWNKYNPWKAKMRKFPEEQPCALCDTTSEFIFPIQLDLCEKCIESVAERSDIWRTKIYKKVDFKGFRCLNCGNVVPIYYSVQTRVCRKCTTRLGKNQKRYHSQTKYARKVA